MRSRFVVAAQRLGAIRALGDHLRVGVVVHRVDVEPSDDGPYLAARQSLGVISPAAWYSGRR